MSKLVPWLQNINDKFKYSRKKKEKKQMNESTKKPQGMMDKIKDFFAKMDKKIQEKAKGSSCCCSSKKDDSSSSKSCCS